MGAGSSTGPLNSRVGRVVCCRGGTTTSVYGAQWGPWVPTLLARLSAAGALLLSWTATPPQPKTPTYRTSSRSSAARALDRFAVSSPIAAGASPRSPPPGTPPQTIPRSTGSTGHQSWCSGPRATSMMSRQRPCNHKPKTPQPWVSALASTVVGPTAPPGAMTVP